MVFKKKIYEITIKFIVNIIICLLHVFIPDVNSFNNKRNINLNFKLLNSLYFFLFLFLSHFLSLRAYCGELDTIVHTCIQLFIIYDSYKQHK